jgi:hypothetical protein
VERGRKKSAPFAGNRAGGRGVSRMLFLPLRLLVILCPVAFRPIPTFRRLPGACGVA